MSTASEREHAIDAQQRDRCVDVVSPAGHVARVHLSGPVTPEASAALGAVIDAAVAKFEQEHRPRPARCGDVHPPHRNPPPGPPCPPRTCARPAGHDTELGHYRDGVTW